MMKLRLIVLALLATLLGGLLGPLSASAAASHAAPASSSRVAAAASTPSDVNPFADIAVHGGPASGHGTFTGRAGIYDFAVQNGHLVARIMVNGVVQDAAGTHAVSGIMATAPATVTGTCQVLNLVLGPVHLNLLGLVVDLYGPNNGPITLTITAQQGQGLLLGNLVCAIANLLNGGGSAASLANLLNQLLAVLQRVLSGLTSTFVAGPGNTLVQNVAISGTVVATTTATITASAPPTTTSCPVLTLTLGPLHLNLLGLVVDLSQVNLNITAQRGASNLLGNLVCGIANLLNQGAPASTIAPLLNALIRLLPFKLVPIPLLLL
jgi:hypothetical protein